MIRLSLFLALTLEQGGWSQFEVEGLEWKLNWTSRMTMSAWEGDIYIVQKSQTGLSSWASTRPSPSKFNHVMLHAEALETDTAADSCRYKLKLC